MCVCVREKVTHQDLYGKCCHLLDLDCNFDYIPLKLHWYQVQQTVKMGWLSCDEDEYGCN